MRIPKKKSRWKRIAIRGPREQQWIKLPRQS